MSSGYLCYPSDMEKKYKVSCNDGGGIVWFLGAIGAGVYYIQNADTFMQGALGVLKALVWPAFIVYKLLGM